MLVLHSHPLSSYVQKVLIALYEAEVPFEPAFLDLADPACRERFLALWPFGKMPVLEDRSRGCLVPESSVIIDYLASFYPGAAKLVPSDPDLAWRVRLMDRVFDLHVQTPLQAFVNHRLGRPGCTDENAPAVAKEQLMTAYDVIEARLGEQAWAVGDAFTMADCAAAPALFYADRVLPLKGAHPRTAAYLERLKERPSYARALREAQPYMSMLPI
jgi:glutathione S-transferase